MSAAIALKLPMVSGKGSWVNKSHLSSSCRQVLECLVSEVVSKHRAIPTSHVETTLRGQLLEFPAHVCPWPIEAGDGRTRDTFAGDG